MISKEHYPTAKGQPFNQAIQAFRGYPNFGNIPEELFVEAARIADAQNIEGGQARDRIATIIYQDRVLNKGRKLDREMQEAVFEDMRAEVNARLQEHNPKRAKTGGNVISLFQRAR